MDTSNNSPESIKNLDSLEESEINSRRAALEKIGKYSTYIGPVILLTISGKVIAFS